MKKIFLVEIEITSVLKEWDYEPGTRITIPVNTNSAKNALRKVENNYAGSEYPSYLIRTISECDDFLFKPML